MFLTTINQKNKKDYSGAFGNQELYSWNEEKMELNRDSKIAFFGFVYSGNSHLVCEEFDIKLKEGQFFCVYGQFSIEGGKGILISHDGNSPQSMIGASIESAGRLKYIDGCYDSLLVPPSVKGDSCLNALYFPEGIIQTQHTHPSVRMGLVYKGGGVCRFGEKTIDLMEGDLFIIDEELIHSFETTKNEGMIVIAFHPDSDCGPDDINHPMINRTMINGKSAAILSEYQTH